MTLLEVPGQVGDTNPTLLYYPNLDVFFINSKYIQLEEGKIMILANKIICVKQNHSIAKLRCI